MKIRLDKNYTQPWMIETIKEAMKEFKEMYTDGDLKRAFEDSTGIYIAYNMDIIKCDVEAFDAGYAFNNRAAFKVTMLLDGYNRLARYIFYTDKDLNLDLRTLNDGTKMYSAKVYQEI